MNANRAGVVRQGFSKACAEWNSGGRPTGIESIAGALLARPATVPRYCVSFVRTNPLTGVWRRIMMSPSPTVPGPSRQRGSALPDVAAAYLVVK
jgi:hypothetical protein